MMWAAVVWRDVAMHPTTYSLRAPVPPPHRDSATPATFGLANPGFRATNALHPSGSSFMNGDQA